MSNLLLKDSRRRRIRNYESSSNRGTSKDSKVVAGVVVIVKTEAVTVIVENKNKKVF